MKKIVIQIYEENGRWYCTIIAAGDVQDEIVFRSCGTHSKETTIMEAACWIEDNVKNLSNMPLV
jgi:hypothetical protein